MSAGAPEPRSALLARRGLVLALVALGAFYGAWLGFRVQTMGDYPGDYAPAMNALLAGHIGAFFAHLPTNGAGGSVLLRAPAAWLGKELIGSQLAIFRFGAFACLLAAGALGLHLARGLREAGEPPLARACAVGVCLLAPPVLDAIFFGHPDEPLGAALCVGAVLLAAARRPGAAGVVLGLALINKPWGVLAVPCILLCARQRRVLILVLAGSIGAMWVGAAWVSDPGHFAHTVFGASNSIVAHPVDIWWPLAHRVSAPGVLTAYFPPHVVSAHARELSVLLALPLGLALARRGDRTAGDCLALLALLFLLRCLLDPSNHVYYQVPFVLALTAWEAWCGRAPLLAFAAMLAFWLEFHAVSGTGSLTAQFIAYHLIALPLAVMLLRVVLGEEPLPRRVWVFLGPYPRNPQIGRLM